MAALLDREVADLAPGGRLPALAHWLYFTSWAPQSQLGSDGHPRRGGFMPPIELPRRMFAGARMTLHRDLRVGETAERHAEITAIQRKSGGSGTLIFVTVRFRIFGVEGLAIEEEQDIVYRDVTAPAPARQEPAPEPVPAGAHTRAIHPDPVLLFRFSALTSNAHRIHYDRPYAVEEEGYPGLVVHGPLQAMLLLDLVREHFPGRGISTFRFQARRPIFDTGDMLCVAQAGESGIDLSTRTSEGHVAMSARAQLDEAFSRG
ncbi:MAG TPA: MaoC family dehydratase N-terminal domain-containing protein [Candidatus Dormibacteraeota bacterium]|nr:MaoC family dehydratase N-terminal domain-containing protein [Candidatus Dormibacteraeota bacterium]